MGAERCIVLLVVVVMGAGLFVVNSVVDEDMLRNYSEEVAEYNEIHEETLLDSVMHKKSHPDNYGGELANVDSRELDHKYNRDRVRRSSGQGMNEDPEHDQKEQNKNFASLSVVIQDNKRIHTKTKRSSRVERSSGQGINEDPERDDHDRIKRSSGQGINEDPERDDHDRIKRSSGQGINEDPEHDQYELNNNRDSLSVDIQNNERLHTQAKRSSGQGINEDPEHEQDGNNVLRRLRSTRNVQGVHNIKPLLIPIPEKIRSKRSSGQGINEADANPEDDSSFLETASNLDVSVEDDNGAEEDAKFLGNNEQSVYEANDSSSVKYLSDMLEVLAVGEINPDGDEQDQNGESDDALTEGMLQDLKQFENTFTGESIPFNEESKSENGNDGDGISHDDNILNPYEYHYDLDGSEGHPQIGYSIYSENNDDRIIKLNKGVDFVLGLMNTMFTGEGELTVDLPNVNKKFGHGIMAGNFNATQGYFRNPATLHRTGDVAITKLGDTISLEVALGLQTLVAGFQHYDLKILKIHQAGTIDVSVEQNSIKMKISLTYAPACNLTVDYVGLNQLDGIKVNITGLGAFQSMFDMLSKWFLDNFTGDFKNIVNQKLAEKAKKAVAREDICKYFPQ